MFFFLKQQTLSLPKKPSNNKSTSQKTKNCDKSTARVSLKFVQAAQSKPATEAQNTPAHSSKATRRKTKQKNRGKQRNTKHRRTTPRHLTTHKNPKEKPTPRPKRETAANRPQNHHAINHHSKQKPPLPTSKRNPF